jgi:hypothetical protein
LLGLAASRGEPHVERRAIDALLTMTDALGDEGQALLRRREILRGRELLPASEPTLPFTPEDALELTAKLVARAAAAAGPARDHDAWTRAIAALAGPVIDGRVEPESAVFGLRATELATGAWRLVAGDGHAAMTTGPLTATPRAVAAALEALAPLFSARTEPVDTPAGPDPVALDRALVAGEREFFGDVATPFKRRELTRKTLRAVVHLGLAATHGLYRALAVRWRIDDYQRFMDFLRRGDALLDYRAYRRGTPPAPD